MGKSVNQVFLIGRLTRDVDLRATPSGKNVASFSLAVDDFKEGNTNFFDVTAWEKLAESVSQYTKKGSKVHVQGRLQQQTWEQDGQKRSKIVVIANDITYLDSPGEKKADKVVNPSQGQLDGDEAINIDDIPF